MKKFYHSALFRIAAVVMLLMSAVFSVFCLTGLVMIDNGYFIDDESYFSSPMAYSEVHSLAWETAAAVVSEDRDPTQYDNTGWLVRQYDLSADSLNVIKRKSLSGYETIESFLWYLDRYGGINVWSMDSESDYINELRETLEQNKGGSAGRVDLYFTTPRKSSDLGYKEYQTYTTIAAYRNLYAPGLVAGGCLTALLLLLCAALSGTGSDVYGTKLYFVDRIPLELLAGVCGGAALTCVICGAELWSNVFRSLGFGLAIITLTTIAAMVFVLMFVLSLGRRIKTRTLLSTTLLYMLYRTGEKAISLIPEMPLTVGCTVGLWLLNAYTAFMQRPGLFMTAVMILNLAAAVFVLYKTWCSNQAATATGLVVGGDLKYRMSPEQIAALTPAERRIMNNLGSISEGMAKAVDEQMKSERMKTELITNVSHDIKTPLTSIINYTDLLRKETDEEKKKEYLEVLSRNAARLKKMTEDLIDASKASTGNVNTEIVSVNLREMVEQAAAEYEEKLEQAELHTVISHEDPNVSVMADGRLLWRVLSNLLSNCVKYAHPGTRVYIDTKLRDEYNVMISVKNISREILNITEEELLERFVRGDQARSSEGSGLGLNIARSLTELMGGTFTIHIDGDLFRADVILPKAEEYSEPQEEEITE